MCTPADDATVLAGPARALSHAGECELAWTGQLGWTLLFTSHCICADKTGAEEIFKTVC